MASKPPVVTKARAAWRRDMLFEAGSADFTRTYEVDGDGKAAVSPVESFLAALATCSGSDVADFMKTRRTPLTRMEIDVSATRRGDYPRRVMSFEMVFVLDGPTVERDQAERAIRLSFEKYCTVAGSMAGDIEARTVLVLNGERGEPVVQPMFSAAFP
jgi:putative redox protein